MSSVVPKHIAIIPDGNRRWAEQHNTSVLEGHAAGAKTVRAISTHAADAGVTHLSLWGMSLDNFSKRSLHEVTGLLALFREEFQNLATSEDIHNRKVHVNVFGRWRERFPRHVTTAIQKAISATANYSNHYLNFFLAYDGTDEMAQAIQEIVSSGQEKITGEIIKQHLFTKDLPPVDLLIRTGGQPHLSAGFMMWDIADAELYFTKTYWPAFDTKEFDLALTDFATRRRLRGK